MIEKIMSNTQFPEEIEQIVKDRSIDYMDAVIWWCEKNNLEIEFAGEMIKKNSVLRSKIQLEAENLNFMRKSGRLPI